MSMNADIRRIERELPHGWAIEVRIAEGFAQVRLECPEGIEWEEGDSNDVGVNILEALEFAKKHAGKVDP